MTDQLARYATAKWEILPSGEHWQHTGLTHRAEISHQSTRQRERTMRRFKSAGHAQRFLSAFGAISTHFHLRRHHLSAQEYRATLQGRFQVWDEVTGVQRAA